MLRASYQNNREVGAFCKLTNSYCLVPSTSGIPKNHFNESIEAELSNEMPVVHTSIAGCRIIGRLTVGNKNGLLVPYTTTETELENLRESLPEHVELREVDETLSALGNVIACNDSIALVHPDLDKETEEAIKEVLKVDVIRLTIGGYDLVGTYIILNNNGALVPTGCSDKEVEELSALLQLPVATGTVNDGCPMLGSGLAVNDYIAVYGLRTTYLTEVSVIKQVFRIDRSRRSYGIYKYRYYW